jgi:hypothetical protein
MALDLVSFGAALKQNYPDYKIENLTYQSNPLMALLPKYEQFGGEVMKMPLIYGNPQNRSASFATANGQASTSALKAFLLTRNSDYSIAEISNEVILASEGDANAFLRAATVEIDGALHALGRSVATKLYRSGSGAVGKAGTVTGSGTIITLAVVDDIVNFEVGMTLQASTTDGGGGSPSRTGSAVISAVDRINGIITLASAGITGLAGNDFIFVAGDYDNALKGLSAWLPYDDRSTKLGASFFSVTRSADATRLGGLVYDGTALPIEEALISGAALVGREGGSTDYAFMNFADWANLAKALGSKVQYDQVKAGADGAIGFTALMINGPRGVIKALPDVNCPKGSVFLLQLNTWQLASLKKAVNLFDTDGLRMLRSSSADSLQIRCFSYSQLGCSAPGYNMHLKIA